MMFATAFSLTLPPLLLLSSVLGYPKGGIEQQVYDDLVRYTKYSSAVYQKICLRPLGNSLVAQVRISYDSLNPVAVPNMEHQFSEITTHTNGFFARDDFRKEIVLVFRGSDANTLADYFTGPSPQ